MSLFHRLKSGVAKASELSNSVSQHVQLPDTSVTGTLIKLFIPVAQLTAQQYKLVKYELKATQNKIEKILLKHELHIIKKKEELFQKMNNIANLGVTNENMPMIKQQLAKLGAQLIRLEEIKNELEVRKAKMLKKGTIMKGMTKKREWLTQQFEDVDKIEAKLDLKEEHVLKIIEHVLELVRHKELRKNTEAIKHIKDLEKFLKKLIRLTSKEAKIDKKEAKKEKS